MTFFLSIAGEGTPVHLRSGNFQGQRVLANQIPTSMKAVTAYENLGATLTAFPTFRIDPLAENAIFHKMNECNGRNKRTRYTLVDIAVFLYM